MVRSKCFAWRKGQRCAYWFALGQFRVTGTYLLTVVPGKILLREPPLVEAMYYPAKAGPQMSSVEIETSITLERTLRNSDENLITSTVIGTSFVR